MILASLAIENYKQYQGSHRIDFPAQGVVAVTGPNGAGKTTLFEAIEWCLYCPRTIPQTLIPSREGVGRTVVTLTLEDPDDGKRYCVQRELRASGTQAEVYLEEEPERPLVQGTREVTRYVANHLIGLPHAAFVSTFFTKQKELQFFGDRSPTDRRVEVGRLLGLEAVREAQRELGEGRSAARSQADSMRAEYERRLGERNLEGEKGEATRRLQEAEARERSTEEALAAAVEAAERARRDLDALRELRDRDAALHQQAITLSGEAEAAKARQQAAVAELERLERRVGERGQLAAIAAALPTREAEVANLERERERARRLQTLQDARRQAVDRAANVASNLQRIVGQHQVAAAGLPEWRWDERDGERLVEGAYRLMAVCRSVDAAGSRQHAEAMQEAVSRAATLRGIEETLAKYDRQKAKLVAERAELLAAGDPNAAMEAASQAMQTARANEQLAFSAIAAARVERAESERLADSLRQHADAPVCPTCTRPLGAAEALRLVAILEAKAATLAEDERNLEAEAHAARELAAEAEQAVAAARQRLADVRRLEDRLEDGKRLIDEETTKHQEATEALRRALAVIGAQTIPAPDAVDVARQEAERCQQLAGSVGLIERLAEEAEHASQLHLETDAQIAEIGEVRFDEGEVQAATDRLAQARRAAAQIETIDVELAHRDDYERQREREAAKLREIAARQAGISQERKALNFDPGALQAASQAEQAASAEATEAREAHATARHDVREAKSALQRLEREHADLRELIELADRKAREADDLTRMYTEFGEFDRFVARHVGPLLAETTERLLSQVTNGKYDHVQFDENYGIEVFDGEEAFPLSGFSGGERDVVALCARLALSEVVGSSALRPPRFLVLDEVFGSLDSERRAQLLETLGTLAYGGHFRQMFIISHVDDVQQSPVMNEAWTIEEEHGISRINQPALLAGALA